MRILLLTHYYPPELGAPQTRLHETACALASLGHQVRVLTGPPHYPEGRLARGYRYGPRREVIDGIEVHRMPVVVRPNRGFVDRMVDQGSFATVAATRVDLARWSDVMLVESPPLFLGLTAVLLGRLARRPYVFHVADPWPDFPIALGALRHPVAIRLARWLERTAYAHAELITTVSPGLVDLLERNPAAHGRVRLLPNGVDTARFQPDRDRLEARREVGWPAAELTVAYLGTVGLAQGLGTLIHAARGLENTGLTIRIVGNGADRARLASMAEGLGLRHLRFEPAVPAARVPTLAAAADALLVMLRAGPLYEHSLPTKLVEGLAAGRPLIVSAAGDAARLVEESGAGIACPPEDSDALRAALLRMATDTDREAQGRAGARVARRFERHLIVATLSDMLEEAARSARRRSSTTIAGPTARQPERPATTTDVLESRRGAALARIKAIYRGYRESGRTERWRPGQAGADLASRERADWLAAALAPVAHGRILDLGCGTGGLAVELQSRFGHRPCYEGIDLLPERIEEARQAVPWARFEVGSADRLPHEDGTLDGMAAVTLFSSLTDAWLRDAVAAEVHRVLKPGGRLVAYDIRYPSPSNPHVVPIDTEELRRLFPDWPCRTVTLTLLPPLARSVLGAGPRRYRALAALPILRSHIGAVLVRPARDIGPLP